MAALLRRFTLLDLESRDANSIPTTATKLNWFQLVTNTLPNNRPQFTSFVERSCTATNRVVCPSQWRNQHTESSGDIVASESESVLIGYLR
jgi:hypothetical protein